MAIPQRLFAPSHTRIPVLYPYRSFRFVFLRLQIALAGCFARDGSVANGPDLQILDLWSSKVGRRLSAETVVCEVSFFLDGTLSPTFSMMTMLPKSGLIYPMELALKFCKFCSRRTFCLEHTSALREVNLSKPVNFRYYVLCCPSRKLEHCGRALYPL